MPRKYSHISDHDITVIDDVIYVYFNDGVYIDYPDGTTRFISNSWYSDINTDNL